VVVVCGWKVRWFVVALFTVLVDEPSVEILLRPEELTSPEVVTLLFSTRVALFVVPPSVVRLPLLLTDDEVDLRELPRSWVDVLFNLELPLVETRPTDPEPPLLA
jgi:hypothetical protein